MIMMMGPADFKAPLAFFIHCDFMFLYDDDDDAHLGGKYLCNVMCVIMMIQESIKVFGEPLFWIHQQNWRRRSWSCKA